MTITSKPELRPATESGRRLALIFGILTAGAAGMSALLALLPAAGHDQIWFLLMARRWLGGAQLYGPEAFDSNPPGIVWLSALPVSLGRLLHVPATTIGKLLVTLAETGASWLSLVFLRQAWRRGLLNEFWALLFAAVVLFYAVPARDFGQRDHMAGFLLLPYVLAAAVRWPGVRLTPLRVAAGLVAGVAICLKPHQALVPLCVELSLLILPLDESSLIGSGRLKHLFRPEPVLVLLTGMAFLTAVRQLAPLYFTVAVPLARETYWAIGHLTLLELVWEAIELCVLAAVAVSVYLACKPRSLAIRTLLVAGGAAAVAYVVQGTGWYYQQLPAISLFGLALVLLLLDGSADRTWNIPRWAVPATASLCVLAVGLTMHFSGYPFTQDRAFAITEPDPAFFISLPRGAHVAILTTSVDEAMMPVERYGLTWAQRTNNLWLLPAILRAESARADGAQEHKLQGARLSDLDALQHRWMVEDVGRWRPELILIERCQYPAIQCQVLEDRHDNLLAWFLRDPAFAALWRNYTYAGARGRFDAYSLKH